MKSLWLCLYLMLSNPEPNFENANPIILLKINNKNKQNILGTLTKHDNMLRAMFSGRMEEWLPNLLIVFADKLSCKSLFYGN